MLTKQTKENLTYKPIAKTFANVDENNISIKDICKKISEIRNSKIPNPDRLRNAGSFFKNPVINNSKLNELKDVNSSIPSYKIDNKHHKVPAAWLIEQCGWKGKRIGNVGTYEKQSLIIINYGNATGTEIVNFASLIQKSVADKFDVRLDMEVNVV